MPKHTPAERLKNKKKNNKEDKNGKDKKNGKDPFAKFLKKKKAKK